MAAALNDLVGELTALATTLYEFLLRTERDPQRTGWRGQLEHYGKTVNHMRLMARNAGLQGAAEACEIQHAHLHRLYLCGTAPGTEEWTALERWPLLMLSSLATPLTESAVDELIDYCGSVTPADEFDPVRAHQLREALTRHTPLKTRRATAQIVKLPVANARVAAATPQDRADPVRYLLQHELMESIGEFFATRSTGPRALSLCADRIQLLGISAAGSGMLGALDSCLLCHTALKQIVSTGATLTEAQTGTLKAWSGLLSRCIERPEDHTAINALVSLHADTPWFPPMQAHELESLRSFLLLDAGADSGSASSVPPVVDERPIAPVVTLPCAPPAIAAEKPVAAAAEKPVTAGSGEFLDEQLMLAIRQVLSATEQCNLLQQHLGELMPHLTALPSSTTVSPRVAQCLNTLRERINVLSIALSDVRNHVVRTGERLAEQAPPDSRPDVQPVPVHCLMVRVNGKPLAINSRGVERIVYSGGGVVCVEGTRKSWRVNDTVYELFELEELLDKPPLENVVARPVLILRGMSTQPRAVRVENVLSSQTLHVRQPDDHSTVTAQLGDGSAIEVVNLNELVAQHVALLECN